MYGEYISSSKGKVLVKGKGKQGDGKGGKSKWRAACDEYWKPGGCSRGHNSKHHPRRQPGRCAICGSTRHCTSQCTRPGKPKAKSGEWDESTWHYDDDDRQDTQWETEEYEASKGKKGKGKGSKPKGKSKGKSAPRSITPRPSQTSSLFAMMSTKSSQHGDIRHGMELADPQKKLPVFKSW